MRKNDVRLAFKYIGLLLTAGLFLIPAAVNATVYTTLYSTIFNNVANSAGIACTSCHISTLVTPNRHAAPDAADFDVYAQAAIRVATMNSYTDPALNPALVPNDAYMPMDPNLPDYTATGVADLNSTDRNALLNWQADGTPYAAATATTNAISNQLKTSVTLNGTINTNTTNANLTAGKDGVWYFQWGSDTSYTSGHLSDAGAGNDSTRNLITSYSPTFNLTGLTCSTSYNYRIVAINGNNTSLGSNQAFSTLACTPPTITAGASISPSATNEDAQTTFQLTYSAGEAGTKTWSVLTQGSKGSFSFDTSTTSNPVTIRYTPTANLNGSDTSGVIRITNSTTGLTDDIAVTMSITSFNDQPVITSTASTSAIEDTQYSYQVVVNDPDNSFGGGLTIGLTNQPGNMAVSSSGLITWTPVNGDTTSGLVTVTVNDGGLDGTVDAVQQFTVSVTGQNDPPVITPGATTTATEDVQYSYQMQVTDIDDTNNGTDISFALSGQPSGMAISNTGLITWTPLEGVLTSGTVTVTVEDGNEDGSTPTLANNGKESFTITVTPVNDPVSITSNAITTGAEDVAYSYAVTTSDVDDTGGYGVASDQLIISLSNQPAGMTVDTSTGIITWTPPRTGSATTYNNITITVEDGLEDGAVNSVQIVNLAVSIADADTDLVADYADNCPAIANVTQADNDNDTVYLLNAGYPVSGDVDSSDVTTGGDACDTDDDNDGMLDVDETMYPGCLDPFNAADATQDCDGDGVDNITEVNVDHTNPTQDSVGPTVTAPADITVDATGLLTVVNLGAPTGIDGNDGESAIFKAAVDLSTTQLDALDAAVTGCQTFSSYKTDIKPFRPGRHVITWATCDKSGNSGRDSQIVNVRPLVSVTSGQTVGEGQPVTVRLSLNGDAITYPATVAYTLTGTARAGVDHDGVDGVITFSAPGDVGVISFNTLSDALVESDETVIVNLHSPSNLALGSTKVHKVTITEANVAPQVMLVATQGAATLGNTVYQPDGSAKIIADAIDANGDIYLMTGRHQILAC